MAGKLKNFVKKIGTAVKKIETTKVGQVAKSFLASKTGGLIGGDLWKKRADETPEAYSERLKEAGTSAASAAVLSNEANGGGQSSLLKGPLKVLFFILLPVAALVTIVIIVRKRRNNTKSYKRK
jgi:hypothetical protein